MNDPRRNNTSAVTADLPGPDELPEADVVIFDGNCRFCRTSVDRLQRMDGQGRLAFVSLHDPEARQRCPDLSTDQMRAQMYVVDRQGRRYGGAQAIRYLSRRLPKLWLLAPLMHIPGSRSLWQALYGWVAQRRYLIGGSTCDDGSCRVK